MATWLRGLRSVAHNATSRSPFLNSQAVRYHTIEAIPRECTGKGVAARDRAQGRIPAVVLSQSVLEKEPSKRSVSRKQLLTAESEQIQSIINSIDLPFFCSTTFQLQIHAGAGSSVLLDSGRVLPIKIHRDEKTGKLLNLVLVWAEDGSKLKVDVPVVFKGLEDCPGLKKGGFLNKIRPTLKYLCPAEHIPSKIEVDLSNLDVEDKVLMRNIHVHPSLKLLSKNDDMPVCKISAIKPENPEAKPENPEAKPESREAVDA